VFFRIAGLSCRFIASDWVIQERNSAAGPPDYLFPSGISDNPAKNLKLIWQEMSSFPTFRAACGPFWQ
jgi:hypothetical protein